MTMKIAGKVYISLVILLAVALAVGSIAISSLRSYKQVVDEMENVSQRAALAERLNGQILAVVMDSRGIYMAASAAESEKYAVPMLKNLERLRATLAEWKALTPESGRGRFTQAETATNQFIRFRSELVRLSRESSLPEARAFGDNDANRKVRSALNDEITGLAQETLKEVERLGGLVNSEYDARLSLLLGLLSVGSIAGLAVSFFVVQKYITGPLGRITGTTTVLAGGNYEVAIPHLGLRDEIGEMARAVQIFKDNALETMRLRAVQEEQKRQAAAERDRALRDLADRFEATVKAKVAEVGSATTGINTTAHQMADRSQRSGGRSVQVGEAAQTTMERAATVAAATSQLSASVNEIAQQVSRSSEISRKAIADVDATAAQMAGLSGAVQSIGDVVNLINDIASQTNLLALNATIEAARAGDAGKGFAVVANEVKNLANQTARATGDIANQVAAVQASTKGMTEAINGVVETIRSMGEASSAIAGAVQEQEAVTRDIAANIDGVATEARAVSVTVGDLARSSAMSCAGTVRVIWSAKTLGAVVEQLGTEADQFLREVRS